MSEDLLKDALENKNESEGNEKIRKMEDPKEVKAAIDALEEKIESGSDDAPRGQEEEKKTETDEEKETETDDEKKTETDEEKETPDDDKEKEGYFTDDVIEKQPEETREVLAKLKGQKKEDLIDSAAKSIASQHPLSKDNEKSINLFKEQLSEKSDEDLINILIDVNKESIDGSEKKTDKETPAFAEPEELELPEIPSDDPEIQKVLEKETLKRLKAKYPNMPEVDKDGAPITMESEEYKEWRRDLNADDVDNTFKEDLKNTKDGVTDQLGKVLYIQNNLSNLYDESPEEVLPLLKPENLGRLKALNDKPMDVLLQDLKGEIKAIQNNLKRHGITEKDLGIDFTITTDEKTGRPYNEVLNKLIIGGVTADGEAIPSSEIIAQRGSTFWLMRGKLAEKFKNEYEPEIWTARENKKAETVKLKKEKLKDETLIDGGKSGKAGKAGKQTYTVEDIQKENDPVKLQKILQDLE